MKYAAGICIVALVAIMYACCAMAGQIDDWNDEYYRSRKEKDDGR